MSGYLVIALLSVAVSVCALGVSLYSIYLAQKRDYDRAARMDSVPPLGPDFREIFRKALKDTASPDPPTSKPDVSVPTPPPPPTPRHVRPARMPRGVR